MTVSELKRALNLEAAAENAGMDNEITGGYVGDLLSWVMANLQSGHIWITIQGHINIVAVASLKEASCIIIAENAKAEETTISKANSQDVPILYSSMNSYELVKALVNMGI